MKNKWYCICAKVSNILVIMVMRTARWSLKYSHILSPKLQKHEFSGRKMPPKRVIGFLRAAICGFDLRLNPTLLRPLWYLPAPRIASLLDNKNCWSILLKNISENNHRAIEGKTQFCQVGQETRGNKCTISIRPAQIYSGFTCYQYLIMITMWKQLKGTTGNKIIACYCIPKLFWALEMAAQCQKRYILLLLERLKC